MTEKKAENNKKCFVIAPIGEEGSKIRERSDQVLKHIIKPSAEECGYETIRADEISKPGIITSQIIEHLINDDLVIADLTGENPNVYYELAVRHVLKKPIIQLIQAKESIPFDVGGMRIIGVDHHNMDSVENCKIEIVKQVRAIEKDPNTIDTPISIAIDLQFLRESKNPLEKSNAQIISMLQGIHSMLFDLTIPRRVELDTIFDELMLRFHQLVAILVLPEEPPGGRLLQARNTLPMLVSQIEKISTVAGANPADVTLWFVRINELMKKSGRVSK